MLSTIAMPAAPWLLPPYADAFEPARPSRRHDIDRFHNTAATFSAPLRHSSPRLPSFIQMASVSFLVCRSEFAGAFFIGLSLFRPLRHYHMFCSWFCTLEFAIINFMR